MQLEFLLFLHTNMTQVVEILSRGRQGPLDTVNIMGADDLATQVARASAAMILT